MNTPLRARTPALPRDEMAGILNGLKKLNLMPGQTILGDRTNVQEAMRIAKEDAKINSTKQIQRVAPGAAGGSGPGGQNVIEISDQSEATDFMPMRYQAPKALRLNQLAEKASSATENKSLAAIVKEFSEVLKMNSSRTLTREAFYFLDVLYKQLDDPSVFIEPTRLVVSFVTCQFPFLPYRTPAHTYTHTLAWF